MENLPIVPLVSSEITTDALTLSKNFFDQYKTLDEKQDLYAEIKKASAATSWMQADFFRYLWGETKSQKTLNRFASDFGENVSTVRNYLRTAEAFPPADRNPMATFSHHFQAWQIDGYDDKTHAFSGSSRFEWLQKAVDNRWGTRQLYEEIMRSKQKKDNKNQHPKCNLPNCQIVGAVTYPVNVYHRFRKKTEHLNYHDLCYQIALNFIR